MSFSNHFAGELDSQMACMGLCDVGVVHFHLFLQLFLLTSHNTKHTLHDTLSNGVGPGLVHPTLTDVFMSRWGVLVQG